ncbi:MAG: protein-glutamate O-methyltransferase CheR [Deltaproteobacteria bacterium]|nr:protein-glutamate O-methyltransferase CheR [Deltaproteobacteria bacterium]
MQNNSNIDFSDETFCKIRDLIYQLTGIFYNEQKKYLIETRLSKRLADLNLKNYEDYFYLLKYSAKQSDEIKELFNSITTNETSFFRDIPQLKVFEDNVLKEILEKIKIKEQSANYSKKIRIWSAGCSTGEEPFTLAIIIMEHLNEIPAGFSFEIIGSDISENVLSSARKGIYNSYTLRNTDSKLIEKYFDKIDNEQFQVKSNIKNMVSFYNINLIHSDSIKKLGNFDIIFCRNVIIYFNNDSKKVVISNLYDALKNSGYLFLGHSESLHFISSSFKLVGFGKTPLYIKE